MVSCLRFLMNSKIIQTNNLIITREAGWCYGILSTVPYEQQKLYGQIILLLGPAREAGLTPREPCNSIFLCQAMFFYFHCTSIF